MADLSSSLTSGKLTYTLAELSDLPRAAVVVEDRYSQVFALKQREIRTWARESGLTVSDRGRIPAEVRRAFEKGACRVLDQGMAGRTSVWMKSSPTKSKGSPVVTDRAYAKQSPKFNRAGEPDPRPYRW